MQKIYCGLFFLGCFVLAACATPTPTLIAPTATPPLAPTAFSTPTIFAPQPSATPAPIQTARPSPSLTRPSTATATKPVILTPTRTVAPTGISWTVRTLLVGPGQPGRLYALLSDQPFSVIDAEQMRLLISDDGGATWTNFSGGLPVAPNCLREINLDYAMRDALYASTCQGLYAWQNGAWKQISSKETTLVAVVYGQSQKLWGLDRAGGNIIKSIDGGKTWQASATGPSSFSGLANLAIDPRDANLLYAIINPKYGGSYLRRGKADGNWDTMPTPMNNAQIDVGMTIDGATGDVYVTANNSVTSRWGVWRSRNPSADKIDQVTWEQVYEFGDKQWATMLASGASVQGLALYVRLRDYYTSQSIVSRSLDSGKTWKTLEIR